MPTNETEPSTIEQTARAFLAGKITEQERDLIYALDTLEKFHEFEFRSPKAMNPMLTEYVKFRNLRSFEYDSFKSRDLGQWFFETLRFLKMLESDRLLLIQAKNTLIAAGKDREAKILEKPIAGHSAILHWYTLIQDADRVLRLDSEEKDRKRD